MSRPKRELRKRFIIFCEGDTEYNYIDSMRLKQGVELALKPVNMHGGGYTNFLEMIKREADNNCLAKFIIIDYDRVKKHAGELSKLKDIIEYCRLQNCNKKIPHFLILDNPDFEYIACLHMSGYQGQDVKKYIEQTLGFKNIENFKAKKDIYDYLNIKDNSYLLMISRLKNEIIKNKYSINKTSFEIKILNTEVMWDNESKRGSNIKEFFDIINW